MASKVDARQRWILLKQALLKGKRKAVTSYPEDDFESGDPKFCIDLLKDPTLRNYYHLKKYLPNSSNMWMVEFLELSGLDLMLEALDKLSSRGGPKIYDALLQLTCVSCVRAVMNSPNGIEQLVNDENQIKKLLQALNTSVILVKKQVFDLLAALCMYSPEGHDRVLYALQHYKNAQRYLYGLNAIMSELQTDNVPYLVSLLSVINALILGTANLQKRARLRNEFIGLHLLEALPNLRKIDDADLLIQCSKFEEARAEDDEDLTKIHDMNCHQDVFAALFSKVHASPASIQLLSILQGLLQLEPSDSSGALLWEVLEILVNRAILIAHDSPETDVNAFMKRLVSVKLERNNQTMKGELIASKPENHDWPEPEASTEESLKCTYSTTTSLAPTLAPPPPPPPPPPPAPPGSLPTCLDKTDIPRPSLRMKKLSWQKLSKAASGRFVICTFTMRECLLQSN
ncbi:inverted formin-2-like [Chiloscyllium plagiosum]|uniref:inverted formin-2-like n=1 Tax=Chiloscyllium plagiosum TaxID=36176 RepID=UPI001CB7F720|nr:inverted formin-2-like [Chiloscyllium plagiosum]